MSIDAHAGPIGTFPENAYGGLGYGSANQNPEAGPCFWHLGYGVHDARAPYCYKPGQNFGSQTLIWLANSKLQCIDQVPSAAVATNIAAAQVGATGAMTLVSASGAGITVGVSITRADTFVTVTGLLAIDLAQVPIAFGQAGTIQAWNPVQGIARGISILSVGDDHLATATVAGYDLYNYPMSEAIPLTNALTAYGKKAFKYVASVTLSGTLSGSNVSVGTSDVIGLPLLQNSVPYIEAWWGAPQQLLTGSTGLVGAQSDIQVPIQLTDLTNSQTWAVPVPFGFTATRIAWYEGKASTTSGATATLTLGINGTAMTGGVVVVAGTNATGVIIPGTTITSGNVGPTTQHAVTITIASPGVVTWPAHGLVAGTPVVFTAGTGGTLPTGLTAGTTYYVIAGGLTANAFEVSASVGGSAVNTTGSFVAPVIATAINALTIAVSSVTTAFTAGDGYLEITVTNNDLSAGAFVAADTTVPATTTTGDVRGTIALPSQSDGVKKLTVFETISVANTLLGKTGMTGVAQNTSTNGG